MLPRLGSSKLVSTWILLIFALSVVGMLDGGFLYSWLALEPDRVWRGQVWRVLTWAFIESSPMGIIFTLITIYKFGGDLAPRWGDRRLRRFMLQIIVAGGVVASVGALVSDHAWNMARTGGWAISDALVIMWARQYPTYTVHVYNYLELGGQKLVWFTVGVTVLLAAGSSPFVYAPELVACFGAMMYPREWLR
jgi:membrane associated rhomboid family serine protease